MQFSVDESSNNYQADSESESSKIFDKQIISEL
jgi:hypothetical protein